MHHLTVHRTVEPDEPRRSDLSTSPWGHALVGEEYTAQRQQGHAVVRRNHSGLPGVVGHRRDDLREVNLPGIGAAPLHRTPRLGCLGNLIHSPGHK